MSSAQIACINRSAHDLPMRVSMWVRGLLLGLAVVSATARARASETRADPEVASAVQGSVFLDPLGLLLFGPRLGADIGTARFSAGFSARWFDPGLLSHALFLNDGDRFGFSYGLALRGRYFLAERQSGLHFGVAAEYLRTRIETPSARVAAVSSYVVPQAEGGYRFGFGHFYADGLVAAGYAIRIAARSENMAGGDNAHFYQVKDESHFYASAALELGVRF